MTTTASHPELRDKQGRFGRGNAGGPGNPFGRQMAERRQWIADAITRETLLAVMATLVKLAIAGDIGAIKLILQYGVGKPAPAADPDRVELEEWNLHQESAIHQPELDCVIAGAPIRLANLSTAALTPRKERLSADVMTGDLELKKVYREHDEFGELVDEYEADEVDDADDGQREFVAANHQTLDAVAKFTRALDGYDAVQAAKLGATNPPSSPSLNGANGKKPAEDPSPNGSNGPSQRSTNGKKHTSNNDRNGRQPLKSRL